MFWLAMALLLEDPATQLAALDPFHVLFDRHPAIGHPVDPVLHRDVQPRAGVLQIGIAAEQLLRPDP